MIGLHNLEFTSANTIFSTIQDILLRLNLTIHNCRGQCYDGASSMSGSESGVATKMKDLEPRALYTHCYEHALNLATQDALKGIKIMEEAMDTVHEITKLIKKSTKRERYSRSSRIMSVLVLLGFEFCVQHAGLSALKH